MMWRINRSGVGGMLGKLVVCISMLLLGTNSTVIDVSKCDSTVARGNGIVCYNAIKTTGSWNIAQQQCSAAGKNLLSIASPAENDIILQLMTANSIDISWIGAVQGQTTWHWIDGSELSDQGCFLDNSTFPDMVNSTVFPGNRPAVCQSHCASSNFTYAALEDGSQCRCGDAVGKYGQVATSSCNTPCPGSSIENCGGPTQQRVISINGGFSNWYDGQPNNDQGYQTCAYMDSQSQYRWNDIECTQQYGVVCELVSSNQVSSFCDTTVPGVYVIDGQCIYVIQTGMTYFNARLVCQQNGGDLLVLKSQAENDNIVSQLQLINSSMVNGYWIGLTRMSWSWTGSDDSFSYTNWNAGSPSSPTSNCATLSRVLNGKWTSTDCVTPQFLICQTCNTTTMPSPVYPHLTTTTQPRTVKIPTTTQPSQSSASSSNHVGPVAPASTTSASNSVLWAAIGGAVGGFVLLLIIVVIVIICCCRRQRQKEEEEKAAATPANEPDSAIIEPTYFFGIENETWSKSLERDKADQPETNQPETNQPDVIISSSPRVIPHNGGSESSTNQPEIFVLP